MSETDKKIRVAVITPIPTPYRDPFWNVVAGKDDIELDVYYCAKGKADRPWSVSWKMHYNAIFQPGWNLLKWRSADASCFYNVGMLRALIRRKYSVLIIGGYNHVTMLKALLYCWLTGTHYYFVNEPFLAYPRSAWRKVIKAPLVRFVVRRAKRLLPTGTLASEYLLHYGGKKEQLVRLPNTPDVERLFKNAQEMRPRQREIRKELGIQDRKTLLFLGRMIPKKGVDTLIKAFARLDKSHDAQVIVVGSGPSEEPCRQLAQELGVADRVHFKGFVEPSEISRWHAIADIFVLPSIETWSASVLESLASCLPVITTNLVGSHIDMIIDPKVGAVVPPKDPDALAKALDEQLKLKRDWKDVADTWAPVRHDVSYDTVCQRLLDQIRADS